MRLQGTVLKYETRSGQNDRGPWTMRTAKILTPDADVYEVNFSNDTTVEVPRQGDVIDYTVAIGARINRGTPVVSINVVGVHVEREAVALV